MVMKKALIITLAIILSLTLVGGAIIFIIKDNSAAPSGDGGTSTTSGSNTNSSSNSSNDNSSSSSSNSSSSSSSSSSGTVSLSQLKVNNGLSGNPCWVGVSGKVYLVPAGTKDWSNGQHQKSGGQVRCGMDTGDVITSSPHGTSVMADLELIGTLGN